ncbi:MAG: hypothetical protein QW228_05600 [Candidatus Aenigmatarchaeota archaeon]
MCKVEIVREITPDCIEVDEWKFYSINPGRSPQGWKQPPVWFSPSYVNSEGKIVLPVKGKLFKTERGEIVIKPSDETNFYFFIVKTISRENEKVELEVIYPADAVSLKFYDAIHSNLTTETAMIITPQFPVAIALTSTKNSKKIVIIKDESLDSEIIQNKQI